MSVLDDLTAPEGLDPEHGRPEAEVPGEPTRLSGTPNTVGRLDVQGHLMSRFIKRDSVAHAVRRRQFPITASIGANGSGKTLQMVHDTLPSLDAGRPVLSTVRILDYRNPRPCPGGSACDSPDTHQIVQLKMVQDPDDPTHWEQVKIPTNRIHAAAHPLYVRLHSFQQLLDFRGGDVLLDEVTGVASSRESQSMPAPIQNWLVQLRRRDIMLRWSSPSWARADKIIREVTQLVTNCAGMARVTHKDETGTKQWRDSRSFLWASYDTISFDEFTSGKREKLDRAVFQRFWRPGSLAELAYDTRDGVDALGVADESGRCMVCGRKRRVEMCPGDHKD